MPFDPSVQTLTVRAAWLAIVAAAVAALSLLMLHVVSAEFQPSWRMVSEYANGRYPWLLGLMFVAWGISYWSLAAASFPIVAGWGGRLGVLLLIVAGFGAALASVFDTNHKLHGLMFLLGVPSIPVAAILLTPALRRKGIMAPWWAALMTWAAIILMAGAMVIFLTSLARLGITVGPGVKPLTHLPQGVPAVHGWANRLLVVCDLLWVAVVARALLRAAQPGPLRPRELGVAG